jgi:hypothetical protein
MIYPCIVFSNMILEDFLIFDALLVIVVHVPHIKDCKELSFKTTVSIIIRLARKSLRTTKQSTSLS